MTAKQKQKNNNIDKQIRYEIKKQNKKKHALVNTSVT